MKKFIIIDGNAIVHRAYHALPPMTTKNGLMVNAVYGFASMLLKVWHDLKPDYIAVSFDLAGPTFRHVKYEKYKATRVKADQELYDQIPLTHELVSAFNIPIYEKQGYEADDVIGTIVEKVKEKNKDLEVVVVTGDMDALQLVRPGVKVYTLRKGMSDIVIYDKEAVKERFGFGPELIVDYKALRGDASDNIPGIPGIGEKTATELIINYGAIKDLYKKIKDTKIINNIKPGVFDKIIKGKDSAEMSYDLALIDKNVPGLNFKLEECQAEQYNRDQVVGLFQKLEFISLLKRLPGAKEDIKNKKDTPAPGVKKISAKKKISFSQIKNEAEIIDCHKKIKKHGSYCLKVLISTGDVYGASLQGVVAVVDNQSFFVPENQFKSFSAIFSEKDIELIVHDVKKLAKLLFLRQQEIKNKIFDLMLASYLLNPGSRSHDETSLALKYIGTEIRSMNGQNSLFGIDPKEVAEDLHVFCLIKEKLEDELNEANNLDLLQKVEVPTALILAQMELNGIKIDLKELKRLSDYINIELKKITKKIYQMAGSEFNIGSPSQLRDVLFEKMEIPVFGIKKGKTGLSTAQAELDKLRGLHPIIEEIENWRELTKLQNTYVDVLPTLVNKKTGRVHTTFNQAVTATGRLSSSDPNLQNIPIRGELGQDVRKTFIADRNFVLISADYSQIELRIVASLAEDKKMIEIFNKGEDIHRATAAAINGVSLDKVTKEMRNDAKQVNFGVLYGMGSYGLSWRTELTQAEAKKFIDKYFQEFNGVKKYIENTISFTRQKKYCETLFGRRRYIPEINASNFQVRSSAERMAINHPVQGTAADLMKMAMIEVDKKLNDKKYGDKVKLMLQVHDEILIEVEKDLAKEVGIIVKEAMESVVKLRVPVVAEVNEGKSWGDIK